MDWNEFDAYFNIEHRRGSAFEHEAMPPPLATMVSPGNGSQEGAIRQQMLGFGHVISGGSKASENENEQPAPLLYREELQHSLETVTDVKQGQTDVNTTSQKRKLEDTQGGSRQQHKPRGPKTECATCMRMCATGKIVQLGPNCECLYCPDCFRALVDSGLSSVVAYPPTCCGYDIDIEKYIEHLTITQRNTFATVREACTVNSPLYCANKSCST